MSRRLQPPWPALLAAVLGSLALASCGGSGSGLGSHAAQTGPIATISQPQVMNLYPNRSSTSAARLTLIVTSVGTAAVSMPVIFDTGSAGITLYAPDIFPATMVGASGFQFPAGQTQMTWQGIIVTSQAGTRTYGIPSNSRTQNGNIGFATVTFGDSTGQVVTQTMPVFLYYSVTDVQTGANIPVAAQRGIFGVATTAGTIVIPDSTEPPDGYPACAETTTGTCHVVSPLKYITYGAGVDAGLLLSPATIDTCDISTAGSCPPQPVLTLGLNAALEADFTPYPLVCPPVTYIGAASIAGYPVCDKTVAGTLVSADGVVVSGTALFDSGTPEMIIPTPVGSAFPDPVAAGTSVNVMLPNGYAYDYQVDGNYDAVLVEPDTTAVTVIGIGYFTTNALFIDYTSSTEGWK
jgi:hypothetical protein